MKIALVLSYLMSSGNSFVLSFFAYKKVFLFIILISIIVISAFALKREIGALSTSEDTKKYESKEYLGIKYCYNGVFHNIFNPITDFKLASDKEDNSKEFNFFKMLLKRYKKPENGAIKVKNLKKEDFEEKPTNDAVYWLGHSSLILELNGKRVIVDPIFANASSLPIMFSRWHRSPIKRKDLPKIDYVLITHNHYDHLERKTAQFLKKSHFIVPLGVKKTLISWGVKEENITALGWGENFVDKKIVFNAEPAMHFTQRFLTDANKTLWNSYVVQSKNSNKIKIFIAGDGGFGEHSRIIADKYKKNGKFDLIAVEIDAWNVRWPYVHMFPRENVEMIKIFEPKRFLPVHYGVFPLGMHEYDLSIKFLLELAEKFGVKDKILMLPIGGKALI